MAAISKTTFAPMLYIPKGVMDIEFYKKAFGAIELRRWNNDDGSIHVAELSIDSSLFHLHEENIEKGEFTPLTHNGVTAAIGLMVADVDIVMANAIMAGAKETSPAQDYEYGYRQGDLTDLFGHKWTIQAII
jgi:PhnB protein